MTAAAATSPDVTELAATTEHRRRLGAASVIDSIRKIDRLGHDLTRQHAIDVLWLLNSPMVFGHLVRRAGWSSARYEQWLADTMIRELLDP